MKIHWLTILVAVMAVSLGAEDRKAILLAAFGTTHENAAKAYDNIEKVVKARNKDVPVYRAYTSDKVRAILKKRGAAVMSVPEALARMKQDGVTEAAVQSLHVVPGLEYNRKIIAPVNDFQKGKDAFPKITVGKPMIYDAAHFDEFCTALFAIIPADRKKEDAVLLMGHNNDKGTTDALYAAVARALRAGDPNVFLATVEGTPDFETVLAELKKSGAKKVYLMPMLVVAGDHARNDLAGDEDDSWKSVLEKNGFTCVPVLKGLGEYDAFAGIYAARLKEILEK